MPPSTAIVSSVLVETKEDSVGVQQDGENSSKTSKVKANIFGTVTPLVWPNIIMIVALHVFSLYALLTFPYIYKLRTFTFGKFILK